MNFRHASQATQWTLDPPIFHRATKPLHQPATKAERGSAFVGRLDMIVRIIYVHLPPIYRS